MGNIFSPPKPPPRPPAPALPPAPEPTPVQAEVKDSAEAKRVAEEDRKRLRQQRGRVATVLAGRPSLGREGAVGDDSSGLATKKLLGG